MMDRRGFLTRAGQMTAGLMGSYAWAKAALGAAETPGRRPNVVFILADDLGWGDLGCYGNPQLRTPRLDELARQGRMFTNFYVNSPVCSPSRAGILTGTYPNRLGVHGHFYTNEANAERRMPDWLDPKAPLVTRLFQQQGYKVGHFGKWHLGGPWQEDAPPPTAYGIDEQITHVSSDQQLWEELHRDPRIEMEKGEVFCARFSESITNFSIDFIEKHKDEPFFLNVWHWMPHSPVTPNAAQMAVYDDYKPDWEPYTAPEQVYYAAVTDLDHHIGRMLDRLEELGLADNTIVVFCSDNGPEDIAVPNARHSGYGSPGVFRGRKRSLYEGGIREPLIVRWPAGGIPANTIDQHTVVNGTDFLPTLLSLAGIDLPTGLDIDGQDMSAAFKGTPMDRAEPVMWEYRWTTLGHPAMLAPQAAMRDGVWKLLMNPDGSRVELYNLAEDPYEVDNLANEYPQRVAAMSAKLQAWCEALPASDYRDPTRKQVSKWRRLAEIH